MSDEKVLLLNEKELNEQDNQESASDTNSNSASIASRISDVDSGIEDCNDEMTVLANPIINTFCEPKNCLDDEAPCLAVNKEFSTNFLSQLENTDTLETCTSTHPVRRDMLASDGIASVCGLNNLGNTCFMNSALQCLFATSCLKDLFYHKDILQKETSSHEPSSLVLFVERIQELFEKVGSGKYSTLHPSEFHAAVGRVLPLFADYKQHDSQEFISFVLNSLHDSYNRTLHKSKSSRVKTTLNEEVVGEDCKRLKIDEQEVKMESEPDAGVECEENVTAAECAWREYTKDNSSVIVDRFQGQFQSIITCEKCSYISTTYEPFMVLSLSIPHAMDKQFVITWVPSSKYSSLPGMSFPKRYVVTVNKNSCVGDVRNALMRLLKKDDSQLNNDNVFLAEVTSSAHVKILDDRTCLSYVKENKSLYAIEVMTCNNTSLPVCTTTHHSDVGHATTNDHCHEEYLRSNETMPRDVSTLENILPEGTSEEFQVGTSTCLLPEERSEVERNSAENSTVSPSQMSSSNKADLSTWHSCSICLEETFDEELHVHAVCGGLLCKDCLKSTIEFHEHQKFNCAICNRYISSDEYVVYAQPSKQQKKIRQVLVPILFRTLAADEDTRKFNMFGHPRVCLLPSEIISREIINFTNQVLEQWSNKPSDFNVVLTDGSGLSCARCDVFSACTGCRVMAAGDDEVVKFKPGSCLTIHFSQIDTCHMDTMRHTIDDSSMTSLRRNDDVTLHECLESFADVEYLGADNPWYCPQCHLHQASSKSMSVTKWPDVLIVHLKRFYFEGSQGCKVTCPVPFPQSNLNVDVLSSAVNDSLKLSPVYDLYGCVNHVGSLYGGHYTALTKQPQSKDWYLFNDESFDKTSITEEDYSKGYVLFYQNNMW